MIFNIGLLDKQRSLLEEIPITAERCFVLSWLLDVGTSWCDLTGDSNQTFLDTWNTGTHGYSEYELDVANNCCLIFSLDMAKQIVFLLPVFSCTTKFVPKAATTAVNCVLVMARKHIAYELTLGVTK